MTRVCENYYSYSVEMPNFFKYFFICYDTETINVVRYKKKRGPNRFEDPNARSEIKLYYYYYYAVRFTCKVSSKNNE